ncbi:anti-sigma factor [Polaromonas sp. C04]|uniref:anti-sigma factor n=1 Tax=Polaromonas sp. C04 TaxID=1945857 RepID=UPI0009878638|nr:anti-sigma factor [Polaromonas sp. C04]OOG60595.1 RNA polymerase subunit sigma-70 [Polaromonas sp. C04]
MNILDNPLLLEQLAAGYALGTLRGGARRRFETLARSSPTVRASALIWQERFASMTELQAGEVPGPNVWKRIENLLAAQPQTRAAPVAPQEKPLFDKLRRALSLWRGAAFAGALASVAAVLVGVNLSRQVDRQSVQLAQVTREGTEVAQQNAKLAAQLKATPEIQYVAVLADDKAAPSMLATFDPKNRTLTLKRVGSYQEASDKSLQLWALPPAGPAKSLGVLGDGKVVRLAASEGEVRGVPALAITLESKGGVPPGTAAKGPVLFKGALLSTAL